MAAWTDDVVVSASGTRDHDSINDFEAAYDGISTSDGNTLTARIRGSVAQAAYWNGWQSGMDADTRILVTYTTGNQVTGPGIAGDQANITHSTNGRFNQANTEGFVIDFVGIGFSGAYRACNLENTHADSEAQYINCVFENNKEAVHAMGFPVVNMGGCLVVTTSTTNYTNRIYCNNASCALTLTQMTVYGPNEEDGVRQDSGTLVVENTVVAQSGPDYNGTMTRNNTRSEDSTGTSAGSDVVITANTDWVDAPNGDFTPYAGGELDGTGKAQPSWYTDWTSKDMAGNDWRNPGSSPEIGCFAIAAASGNWAHKFNGVAGASIGKINGVAIASVGKVNGVAI